jgi:threonyl-tRNA synthetase
VHFPEGSPSNAEIARLGERAFYGPMYNLNWNVALGGGWRYQDED